MRGIQLPSPYKTRYVLPVPIRAHNNMCPCQFCHTLWVSLIAGTSHLYTLFPLFFPLAVQPVNSYVLHGFTHKLCLFELFLVMYSALTGLLSNTFSQLFIICFHVCNWIVCFIHSGIGAWGQRPQQFFQRKAPPPNPSPHWLYVLD